jgi:5-methylcytosine-specific restriction protein A
MTWSRESRQARGYGAAWDKLRLVILRRDKYLCQCDQCKGGQHGGRLTPANQVNHKVSKAEAKRRGWTQAQIDDPSNLEAINADCHKRVTAQQQGRTLRPRGCDTRGVPLDPAHHWNRGGDSEKADPLQPGTAASHSRAEASIRGKKGP